MSTKLIIFDMDGTILNTIEDIAGAVNYILAKYDMPLRTVDEVKSFVGNGLRKTLIRSVPGEDEAIVDKIYDEFLEYYKEHSGDHTEPYEDIVDVLKDLREKKGYKLAVVSNKKHEAVLDLCEKYFKGCFDMAIGEQDGIPIKPEPDMIWEILQKLYCYPEETIYVGDSEVDLMTAKNSCLECVSVSWGFRTREFLVRNGAITVVDTPMRLYDWLDY